MHHFHSQIVFFLSTVGSIATELSMAFGLLLKRSSQLKHRWKSENETGAVPLHN